MYKYTSELRADELGIDTGGLVFLVSGMAYKLSFENEQSCV
jgi:hypothetical protein